MKSSSGSISGCLVALFWVKGFSGFLKLRLSEVGSRFIFGEISCSNRSPHLFANDLGWFIPRRTGFRAKDTKWFPALHQQHWRHWMKWQWISGREFLWKNNAYPPWNEHSPWKWMVGIRSFPIGFRPIFRGENVSFREGNARNSLGRCPSIARFSLKGGWYRKHALFGPPKGSYLGGKSRYFR